MQIRLNGAVLDIAESTTLATLVAAHVQSGQRVAAERNGEIVPRSAYADTVLMDGDRVELVVAVGGG